MKRFAKCLSFLLLLSTVALAQQSLVPGIMQSWTETVTLAPPALVAGQSFSTTSGTGFTASSSGGSISAGTYRCGVTFFTATNTESPLSADSASTSTITLTGSTSSVTISAPNTTGVGANVVGWRPYCGVSGGASGAETVVTITASVCPLSASSTPSCSLNSPAVLTLNSQFTSGSGGPSSPGTAVFPAISNAANQAVFENSQFNIHTLYWTVSGTAPGTCTIQFQSGATVAGLSNVGAAQTCTSSGSYSFVGTNTFFSLNLSAYTAGGTNTSVVFTYQASSVAPISGTPSVVYCGATSGATANCGNTFGGNTAHMFGGLATLASNAQVVTFAPGFTSTSTYNCVANDTTTRANPVQMLATSATTATITNTTGATDVISWVCVGF